MEFTLDEKSVNMTVLEVLRHDFHFPGHLLPGTAFLLMGFWWIYNSLEIYFSDYKDRDACENECLMRDCEPDLEMNLIKNSESIRRRTFTATYNGEMPGLLHCEGFYKLLYASVDLGCHVWVVCNGGNPIVEGQHMTIYIFFIIDAFVNILHHTKLGCRFPKGTECILPSITWIVFGFLFLSHKHGKDAIQIYYHSTLAWVAISVGVMSLVQFKYDGQVLVALFRGICCALAGSWLYQIAFTFHNPLDGITQIYQMENHSSEHDHNAVLGVMIASSYLTWHLIGIILIVGIVYKFMSGRNTSSDIYYKRIGCC